ncbi:helicase-related protein [soil metagenome]
MDIVVSADRLKPNTIVRGPIFPEPVQVLVVVPLGESVKVIGKGLTTGQVYEPILNADQLSKLEMTPEREPFDGDAMRFRLGVEALRLGLAYEYDPYFSLSIARVDPLPHQLEAVYDYFMKLPRIRFLLADDPGAGKTIMAGLLIKELKIRGLIKRTLIVTPANLSFQWQREMKDKFRENFELIRSDVLRANYGSNPWQEKNQVITSVSWVSRIEDAKESLLRSHWDLIIVDEAHKMSAYDTDKKTLAYKLGESLSGMTDHYLLMTATPHKGDPENFRLFLELLDRDVYGDVKSLEEAMRRREAPFYLRRVKEALVTFPDPDTGKVKMLFTKRHVQTSEFQITDDEWDFYDALTRYVEDQSIKAASDDSARGRALGFTMAMLQRRFASSVYAVRRSLERMKEKRERILADPEGYRQEQITKKLPEDFEDLPEEERQDVINQLEGVVASVDPAALKEEIFQLSKLIDLARTLETREVESKLVKLRDVITEHGVFADPKMKLLIFTEHKDTLDYLVGDGKDGRPFGKLREWGLTVTQIHGGMKIGDRDTPSSRIGAEREFKEECQVLVATEAAGEGINLQFCWFMINYDIPWNPVRLEQRMGRIHRYGQEKDCLVFNFVSTNTREGRVLHKLFERLKSIEDDLDPKRTGKIFNVLGDIFPANQLERMLREMYAHNLTEEVIKHRIVEQVDTDRFRRITSSTLEGLAKRQLNLSAIIGKSAEAKERRLVPEVIEDFFVQAAPLVSVNPKQIKTGQHVYRVGRVPRTLWPIGERLEPRFGRLGREYKHIVFDKKLLTDDATLEWVTPGHPLFEAVREDAFEQVQSDLRRGAVFLDINRNGPARLDVFSAAIRDGSGNVLHRRLFVIECDMSGGMIARQPTMFLDLALASGLMNVPNDAALPARDQVEQALIEQALQPFLKEVAAEREKEVETISRHMEISLNELIHRQSLRMADLHSQQQSGDNNPLTAANIKTTEDKLDELNGRLDGRREALQQERNCAITDIHHQGRAWVLPHPERTSPGIAPMVRDEEIERIAVEAAIAYEESRGWQVVSVEAENRGFDLISRKPHPEDPQTAIEVRFIEVKGRAMVGEIALTTNEYKTAERLKKDFWLYVVFNCATNPEVNLIRDPARLGWKPIVKVEHYHITSTEIAKAVVDDPDRVEISIRIQCDLSETRGSEFWDVKSVTDERDGSPFGDIGIYEFNAYSDFADLLMNAVLRTLNEEARVFNPNLHYSVQVEIYDGGSKLGQALVLFSGKDTLHPNFAREASKTEE